VCRSEVKRAPVEATSLSMARSINGNTHSSLSGKSAAMAADHSLRVVVASIASCCVVLCVWGTDLAVGSWLVSVGLADKKSECGAGERKDEMECAPAGEPSTTRPVSCLGGGEKKAWVR
jgi:hypothetical protein